MAKIIAIDNDIVVVGMDDGSAIEVSKADFNFEIREMLNIDVYKHDDKYIFSLKEGANNQTLDNTVDDEKPIPGKRYVNKIPYVLWFFFLGGFGVHEFYAGNVKKGFAWLIFTILMYIFEGIPVLIMLSKYSLQETVTYIHENGAYGQGISIYLIASWGYYFLIRLLAIISMFKKSNENGKILIAKW